MKTIIASLLLSTVLLCISANCAEPTAYPPNAALQYWLAFSFLSDISKEDRDLIGSAHNLEAGPRRTDVVQKMEAITRYLHRGAVMPGADWGTDIKRDGPGALLPHLAKCRQLARAGLVAAREHFDKGRHKQSVDAIFDVLALGRHTGDDGTLIGKLVDIAITSMALDALAQELPTLQREELEKIDARFAALPKGKTLADALKGERMMGMWIFEHANEPGMLAGLGGDEKQMEVLKKVMTPETVKDEIKKMDATYDALETVASVPYSKIDAAQKLLDEQTAKSIFAKMLVPAVSRSRVSVERLNADMEMTHAATLLLLKGEADFQKIRDPYGDGPFGYKKLANGFELSTKLDRDGKPMTKLFGEAARKPRGVAPVEAVKPPTPPPPDKAGDF